MVFAIGEQNSIDNSLSNQGRNLEVLGIFYLTGALGSIPPLMRLEPPVPLTEGSCLIWRTLRMPG